MNRRKISLGPTVKQQDETMARLLGRRSARAALALPEDAPTQAQGLLRAAEVNAIRREAALQQRRHDVAYLRAYGYRHHVGARTGAEAVEAVCDALEDLELAVATTYDPTSQSYDEPLRHVPDDDAESCGECGDILDTNDELAAGRCADCPRGE